MPQMAPTYWILMMILSLFILINILIKMYFFPSSSLHMKMNISKLPIKIIWKF